MKKTWLFGLALSSLAGAEPQEPARFTLTPQMVSREEFDREKATVPAPLQPSKVPPRTAFDPEPPPQGVPASSLGAVLKRLQRSFFVENSGERASIEGDVSFLPGILSLDVKWTRVLDDKGRDVLRAPTAEESEHDQTFARSALSATGDGPTYRRDVSVKQGVKHVVRAEGQATVVLTGEVIAFDLSCAKLGVPVRQGGQQMTLRRCENNFAQVDWTLPETGPMPEATSVLRDASGRRLRVPRSAAEPLLADGRTFAQVEYKELPVTAVSRRMSYLASGQVATVSVVLLGASVKRTVAVVATSEPRFDRGKVVRVEAPRYWPTTVQELGLVKAGLAEIKGQTHVFAARTYAMSDYNRPELAVELPRHDNSIYATVIFAPAVLTSASGATVAHEQETVSMDYPELRQRTYLEPNEAEGDGPLVFARARGVVKVHYPLAIEDVVLTKAQPSAAGVRAEFDGARVFLTSSQGEDGGELAASFAPHSLDRIQAFDDGGNRLRRLSYSAAIDDREELRFWGEVARVQVRRCTAWTDYEVPYDLPPAPLLPKGHEGERP